MANAVSFDCKGGLGLEQAAKGKENAWRSQADVEIF